MTNAKCLFRMLQLSFSLSYFKSHTGFYSDFVSLLGFNWNLNDVSVENNSHRFNIEHFLRIFLAYELPYTWHFKKPNLTKYVICLKTSFLYHNCLLIIRIIMQLYRHPNICSWSFYFRFCPIVPCRFANWSSKSKI